VWRRASRAAAGILAMIAVVVLVMIAPPADDPPLKILVPPLDEVGPYVPPTSVVVMVATQPIPLPATISSQQQTPAIPKPVTHQPATPRQTAPQKTAPNQTAPNQAPAPPAPETTAVDPPPPPPPPAPSPNRAIVCPNVAGALPAVPPGARADVARELRYLDASLAEANQRLRAAQSVSDPGFVQNAILGPLTSRRIASLDRIAIAISRFAARPAGLERLARCSLR
jgi:hypothetical protein